jgi:hypothetical protein
LCGLAEKIIAPKKENKPSLVILWIHVWLMAFIPYGAYFFVLWMVTEANQEVKLLAALTAMFVSPFCTLTAAQMIMQDLKDKEMFK